MNCPNFRVLSDFRKDHGDFFQDCFKQTVKLALALELKLASLGVILFCSAIIVIIPPCTLA